jgi:queuine tRNA-ribosyltransferase
MGGLHRFMAWKRPLLTDSGGYQVFSHLKLNEIMEDGVRFRSHIDGSRHYFTPELSMAIQRSLGADIIMAFDECIPYPADHTYAEAAVERTRRWEMRSRTAHRSEETQTLFGIVQGGMYKDLRTRSAEQIREIGFSGYAIGGLSVGEPKELFLEMLDHSVDLLPSDRPRYLMGVGTPVDLVNAVWMGVDMFDCVLPTRNGRNGMVFTWDGPFSIRNAEHKEDGRPIDPACTCRVCRTYSRGYLRHLYKSGEILGLRANSYHNLFFYQDLMRRIRQAIEERRMDTFRAEFLSRYRGT